MRRFILSLAACLLALPASAQSGRRVNIEPQTPERLLGMSFTKTLEISAGNDSRRFVYQMFVKDDYRAATVQPITASVKLKVAYARLLDNIVTADVRLRELGPPPGISAGEVALTGSTTFDPLTGLPDYQELGGTVRDKNGRPVFIRVRVAFSQWKRRKVEVRVLEEP